MPYIFCLESPNKVKKLQEYLGDDYLVTASKGHIRTLGEEKNIGIAIENNFQPEFHIDPKKRDVVAKLRAEAGRCDTPIYLATDADREGEAISWHIMEVLGVSLSQVKRVVFTEITKKAVLTALENPKELDMNMVNSQLARQILDKLIGFKVSPCLWKEFKNWKLSAGRVQSVVTKLIIEREQEILKFASSNYFKVSAGFNLDNSDKIMRAKKTDITTELDARLTDVDEVSNIIANTDSGTATYWVDGVTKTKSKRQPSAPFITSSLQQEASNKLGMSPDETMSCAQKLYEAGLITYMRTDSLMLSEESLGKIGTHIKAGYGEEYHRRQQYTKKAKGAQEAHEAIRPTDVGKQDASSVAGIKPREAKLYGLIWKRTVASQMAPADVEIKTVKVRLDHSACNPKLDPAKHGHLPTGQPYTFVTKHEKILFDGFLKLYSKPSEAVEGNPEENGEGGDDTTAGTGQNLNATESKRLETLFDSLKKGQQVWCGFLSADEKQTKPPNGRYTEASLVKKLEDLGIGRPSTYASMVGKVQEKSYIEKKDIPAKDKEFRSLGFKYPNELVITSKAVKVDGEKNKLIPSSLGIMITGFLIKNFELFMDYDFTANIELLLDQIAEGGKPWQGVVQGVWDYLSPIISRIETNMIMPATGHGDSNIKSRSLGINPATGNEILVKRMRTGWSIIENNIRDTKQSKFASLGLYNPETITLAEALPLLVWPKNLGFYDDEPVILNKKSNIYITYDGKHYSIENYSNINKANPSLQTGTAHENINLATAITIINYFKTQSAGGSAQQVSTDIKFDGVDDYVIKQGPYGYYIKYLNMYNVPLPANVKKNISLATKENCDTIIKNYLSNKGQSTSLADIKIKPAATKAPATTKAQATTKKASAAKTVQPDVPWGADLSYTPTLLRESINRTPSGCTSNWDSAVNAANTTTITDKPVKVKTQRKKAVTTEITIDTTVDTTPVKKETKPRAPRKKKE
jgi:DNA topoisomerase-1